MRSIWSERAALLLVAGIVVGLTGCRSRSAQPLPAAETEETAPVMVAEAPGFQNVCLRYAQAVGLITYTIIDEDGKEFHWENEQGEIAPVITLATAFAVGPHEFVTNAHVAAALQGISGALAKDVAIAISDLETEAAAVKAERSSEDYYTEHKQEVDARLADLIVRCGSLQIRGPEIRLSHSNGKILTVTALQSHPKYRDDAASDAEQVAYGESDVALLTTTEAAPCWFPVADRSQLEKIGAGMRIGSLGFPMEGLFADGGINPAAPEATFKDGCIGKVIGSDCIFGPFEHNRTVVHSIPQTQGSSGSPVFLADGTVIAVFWGTSDINGASDEFTATNPVQQNFAVRIDALEAVRKVPPMAASEWLRGAIPQTAEKP